MAHYSEMAWEGQAVAHCAAWQEAGRLERIRRAACRYGVDRMARERRARLRLELEAL